MAVWVGLDEGPAGFMYENPFFVNTKDKGGGNMGIIGWIIIGALAGWIASMVTGNNKEMGALMNIMVGIIGGFVGGLIMNLVGGIGITGFNLWSLLVACAGAVILLLIVNAFNRKPKYN